MQGKSFTVESGTVTFVGADPTNPEIVVKASWPAPDGTTVYASFIGAVTAKVDTSQSTMPRPEVEIQIARDISLQLAVVLGQPSPGVNPDHTLLTLD